MKNQPAHKQAPPFVHPPDILSPKEAWDCLAKNTAAVLVDVRCRAEWMFVGVPDLSSLGKQVLFIEWQDIAGMANPNFIPELQSQSQHGESLFLMLCRSGKRSHSASLAALAAGFKAANIGTGFEGDLDDKQRRKTINGWCVDGLPWQQM